MKKQSENESTIDKSTKGAASEPNDEKINFQLSKKLEENINIIKELFNNDGTLVMRNFENQENPHIRCCLFFIDGMINNEIINENIIRPIVRNLLLDKVDDAIDVLAKRVIDSNDVKKTDDLSKLVESMVYGDTMLFVDGFAEGLIISTKGWLMRSISEPETEKVLQGPREGFNEAILINLSLIRRRIKSHNLKFQYKTLGERSNTKICVCYIEGIVNEAVLEEVNRRLDAISLDGILSSSYIEEMISDTPYSPFKTIGNTERPDVVAANLLEGRVAIIVDGTPTALTLPYLCIENFQSNEDYYTSFVSASVSRMMRIFGFFFSTSIPAIYVALITYHAEVIPTPLLISISGSRKDLPFPTTIEALLLIIMFEILREAGARVTLFIGQALSIVGALVIGTAAVDAKFISASMLIIIAFSGISSLMVTKLKGAVMITRILLLLIASIYGLYGYMLGIILLLLHLFSIRSFGVPYIVNYSKFDFQNIKDTFIRAPWWYMEYRPRILAIKNSKRKAYKGRNL
jgi:spore germination protein KA